MANDETKSAKVEEVTESFRKYASMINGHYTALEIKTRVDRFFAELDEAKK